MPPVLTAGGSAAGAQPGRPALALLGYGFRPFFLAVGVMALVYVPWWAGSVALGWQLSTDWPPMLWHGHEMLFGLVVAAIAGFLLTAVPSWTGQRGFAGAPLAALALLWLAGRVAILGSGHWPGWGTAALDLAFLPALALLLAVPLLRARNRNTPLLAVLAALWGCNAVFHWALLHANAPLAGQAVRVGIDIVLLLVTVIGGRVVPAFTTAALKAADRPVALRSWPLVTPVTIGLMALNALADAVAADARLVAGIAAAAALAHAVRLAQWRSLQVLAQPIVWILHLGYAWLALGLALKAAALVGGYSGTAFWLHALTIGAITTMVLGVMTRAALGHTGRPLRVAPLITAAYLLVSAAALVRVFALGLLGGGYPGILLASALLWTAGFGLYLWVYAPILCRPRADGRAG